MTIKNIDNFSLEECNEYLCAHPNGALTQVVNERKQQLLMQLNNKQQKNYEIFNTQYIRHCATQQYEDAFAICLKYLNSNEYKKADFLEKAKSIIPKLKNTLHLPSSSFQFSYEWLIDQLAAKGYSKMKFNGKFLKYKKSRIKIHSLESLKEIYQKYNLEPRDFTIECKSSLATRIFFYVILWLGTVSIFGIIYAIFKETSFGRSFFENGGDQGKLLISALITLPISTIVGYIYHKKIYKKPRLLLRQIAQIIAEYLFNNKPGHC